MIPGFNPNGYDTRSVVSTQDASGQVARSSSLTGLSADQLREWTTRRGLIPPEIKPHGSGTQALYSWQTVLVLRVAITLREGFHLELQVHRSSFAQLRMRLDKVAFHSLWEKAVVFDGNRGIDIVDVQRPLQTDKNFLFLLFDPHLSDLARHFGPPQERYQLSLFPAVGLR